MDTAGLGNPSNWSAVPASSAACITPSARASDAQKIAVQMAQEEVHTVEEAEEFLTRDQEIVDRYIADPYCGFLFTVQGMHDLISINSWVNQKQWYQDVPKALPMLVISGAEDPVGEYGTGVKKVADQLTEFGHQKVALKLYPDCRHEVLNELNREKVMEDLAAWMEEQA